jgi:site-specific DNA recombinase
MLPPHRDESTPDTTQPPVENPKSAADFGVDSSPEQSVNGSMAYPFRSTLPPAPTREENLPLTASDPFAAFTESFAPKRAVSYLRVSTREQAERGGREEGFSIPAQREANKKKAQAMTAMVVKEFVERGVSATSTNRPALQDMLRYLESEQGNIDYVIVHKLDRLARNRADDVALNQRFAELGIRLVSTSENIDQTPGGLLLHGIMSSIAEFYSRNLANEVVKGMNEKVRNGGSVSRAPIGYLNTRTIDNGRENRIVTVDEHRAPLVNWAFEAYATGKWTVRTLTAELVRRGLTTVPTARLAEKPIEVRHLHSVLTNLYYTGVTTFKGVQYPGSHTPLIDRETFEKVQTILHEKINGERSIKHDHYLKSSLYCGRCGFRMVVQMAKNKQGEIYSYYSCLGRHSKRTTCTLRSIQILHVEDLIQELYDRISLAPDFRRDLGQLLRDEMKKLGRENETERQQLQNTQQAIQRRQRKLLEAHYNDAIPMDMLRSEQKRLDGELIETTRRLELLTADTAEAEELIGVALDIAEQAGHAYRNTPDHIRRMFNQLIFEKLLIVMDEDGNHQLQAELAPPFDLIFSARTRALVARARGDGTQESRDTKKPADAGGLSLDEQSDDAFALVDSSNKNTLVELRGLEPLTLCMPCRCATSCATAPYSPPFPVIRRYFFLAPPWQLLYSNGSPPRVQIDPRAVSGAGPAASSSAWWAGDDAG